GFGVARPESLRRAWQSAAVRERRSTGAGSPSPVFTRETPSLSHSYIPSLSTHHALRKKAQGVPPKAPTDSGSGALPRRRLRPAPARQAESEPATRALSPQAQPEAAVRPGSTSIGRYPS